MTDQRIVDYVKSALSNNMPIRQIKDNLISKGWSELDVNHALDAATQERIFPRAPKHSMSVMMAILLIVIVAAGAFGFYIMNKKETKPSIEAAPTFNLVKDCLDNFDCLIQQAQSCKLSKLKSTTTSYEIKGMENGKCALYMKTLQADSSIDGTCNFNTNDLIMLLGRWKTGIFSTEDFKAAECSGTMFAQQP